MSFSSTPPLGPEPPSTASGYARSRLAIAAEPEPVLGPALQDPQDPQAPNVYDSLLKKRQQQEDVLFMRSFVQATKANPDLAAEAQQIGVQLDVDPLTVERNIDKARQIMATRSARARALSRGDDALTRMLLDPSFARIAHDDTDKLSLWQKLQGNWSAGQLTNERGILYDKVRRGAADSADMERLQWVDQQLDALPQQDGFLTGAARILGQQSSTLPEALLYGSAAGASAAVIGAAAGGGTPLEGVTVPVFTAGAFGAGFFAKMAQQTLLIETGNTYGDMRKAGYDEQVSGRIALGSGIVKTALEMAGARVITAPVRAILKDQITKEVEKALLKPTLGKAAFEFAKGWASGVGAETVTETLQEATDVAAEELARRLSKDPDALSSSVTRGEVVQRLVDIATQTAQGMALLGLPGPAAKFYYDSKRVQAAERGQQFFEALSKNAAESKLAGRSPDAYEQFLAKTTDAHTIYVDARQFTDTLRQSGVTFDEMRAIAPDVAAQVEKATRDGTDIVIPPEQFGARIARTSPELAKALIPHLRLDNPDGLSTTEAEQVQKQVQSESSKAIDEQQKRDEQWATEAAKVEDDFAKQVRATKLLPGRDIPTAAALYRDFVVVNAERAGITPQEFAAKFPLQVAAAKGARQSGELAQFAGSLSLTADMASGREALARLQKGEDAEEVRKSTGFFMGPDGRMRYEIDDSQASIRLPKAERMTAGDALSRAEAKKGGMLTLADVLDHPRLFDAYPELRDIVVAEKEGDGATYEHHGRKDRPDFIRVGSKVAGSELADVLLHEVQHAIQRIEGFSKGGDASEGFDVYRKLAGEVEARNTAFRRYLTDKMRREVPPSASADVPLEQQILRKKDAAGADRGAFNPATLTISLYEKSDASTLMHELAHFNLTVLAQLASSENASEQLRSDMQALLDWFGVKDLETWNSLTLDAQRKHHEKFAYSFEDYLYDGKAPTQELQGLFDRIASWMRRVYRNIRDNIGRLYKQETGEDLPILTKEVRGVFDRMLASEEQIQHAEAIRGYAKDMAATDEAVSQLTTELLRTSRWARTVKRADEAARAKIRKEVEPQVREQPVYRATEYIRNGEAVDAEGRNVPVRLRESDLPESVPNFIRNVAAKDGIPMDDVAAMFGFQSGDAMLQAIEKAPAVDDAVNDAVADRMAREHGELGESLRSAVEVALQNKARERSLTGQVAALTDSRTARLTRAAAKERARHIIGQMSMRRINPRAFAAAEARAAKRAAEAGDNKLEAIAARQQQMVQAELVKLAAGVEDEVRRARAEFRKFGKDDAKLAKTRTLAFVDAGRSILARFGLGPQPEGDPMAQWREHNPELAKELDSIVSAASASAKDWRDLSLEQFRDLAATMAELWHRSKRDAEIEVDGKRMLRAEATARMREGMEKVFGPAKERPKLTDRSRRALRLAGLGAMLRRPEAFAHRADGGKAGPVTRYLWRPLRERFDQYMGKRGELLTKFRDIIRAMGPFGTKKIEAPEFGTNPDGTSRVVFDNTAELLGAVAHSGNESNLGNMLVGNKFVERQSDGTVDTSAWWRFMARAWKDGLVTKQQMDGIQAIWDLNENDLKPIAQKVHRDLFGYSMQEIEPAAITTPWGVYRGGYIPSKVDPDANPDISQRSEVERIKEGDGEFRTMMGTPRGFTIARVKADRARLLDLRLQGQHIDEVLRFAYMEPAIRDVASIIRDKDFAAYLNNVDPKLISGVLLPWLDRARSNTLTTPAPLNGLFGFLRRATGLGTMFGNVTNSLQNYTGISNTIAELGATRTKNAAVRYYSHPFESAKLVAEQSQYMDLLLNEQVGQMQDDVGLMTDPSWMGNVKAWTNRHGYFMQRFTQNQVTIITWLGAFDRAMEQSGADKNDEQAVHDAVAEADSVVRRTQGSTAAIDVAAYEKGSAFKRLFTQYSGYANNVLNHILSAQPGKERLKVAALSLMVPSVVSAAIVSGIAALAGGKDKEERDPDGLTWEAFKWMFASQLRGAAGMVPAFGPLASQVFLSKRPPGDRASPAPFWGTEQALERFIFNLPRLFSSERTPGDIRDAFTALSLTGVPVRPIGPLVAPLLAGRR